MKKLMLLGLILITAGGCTLQSPTPELGNDQVIATLVAATRTAASLGQEGEIHNPQTTVQVQATSTAEPGVTTAPTETPSLTPTPSQTPTPTTTLTPTAVAGDPVLSLGLPTFDDDFDSGTNFYTYDSSQASYQIEDGRMVLVAKKANSYETWSLSWGDLTNFYLEATGTFGPECGGKDRYGMIFRAPDTSQGYLISITCDGSYRLSKYESDTEEYTSIKKWTPSDYINAGPGGTNRLGIRVKNSKLTGYINGSQVFEVNDSTFSKGRMGVMVAAANTPGFTAYLDRVAYWKLP